MRTIGLDIGGANIKASNGDTSSLSRPFAMWQDPHRLAEVLAGLVSEFGDADQFAVSMTGELADCFPSKADGVCFILDAVEATAGGRPVYVWQTVGEFVEPTTAREHSMLTAAANWHALATWVGRAAPVGDALLIDIGSTTTDIIPLQDGLPMPRGRTDVERLASGELVYCGVRRTPLCAIAHSVPFRGGSCPLSAEFFASIQDVYLWRGDLDENPSSTETADGAPATRHAAHGRLARMLCCDRSEIHAEDVEVLAEFLADVHERRIAGGVDRVLRRMANKCQRVVLAGEGEFLGRGITTAHRRLSQCEITSVAETIGERHSHSACAYALAQLGVERLRH